MQIAGGPLWLFFILKFIEVGAIIAMTILWLRAMYRAIEVCHPTTRTTEPWTVWLTLIPVFGFVWQFISSKHAGESLGKEYYRRGWKSEEGRPGYELGAVTSSVVCIIFILRLAIPDLHPGFGFLGSIVIGFCMYLHMERLNAYRERLEKEAFVIPDISFQMYHNFVRNVDLNKDTWNPVKQENSYQPASYYPPQQQYIPPQPNIANTPPVNDEDKWKPKL